MSYFINEWYMNKEQKKINVIRLCVGIPIWFWAVIHTHSNPIASFLIMSILVIFTIISEIIYWKV